KPGGLAKEDRPSSGVCCPLSPDLCSAEPGRRLNRRTRVRNRCFKRILTELCNDRYFSESMARSGGERLRPFVRRCIRVELDTFRCVSSSTMAGGRSQGIWGGSTGAGPFDPDGPRVRFLGQICLQPLSSRAVGF